MFLLKTVPLLIFVHLGYLFIRKILSPAVFFMSNDVDPVLFVLESHMKCTVEVVPLCMYIVWFIIS